MRLLSPTAALLVIVVGSALAQQNREGMVESWKIQPDSLVQLAANDAVQKDLGLSDEVARKLQRLNNVDFRKAWIEAIPPPMGVRTGQQVQKEREALRKLNEDYVPKVKELLTVEQYKRLQQIHFQTLLHYYGPKTLLEADTAAELKLTEGQKGLFDTLGKDFARGDARPGGPGGPGGGFYFKDGRLKRGEDYRTKAIGLLADEQKEALNKLEGKEFDLSALIRWSAPVGPRLPAGAPIVKTRSDLARESGALRSNAILFFAAIPAVQKDLGVNEEVGSRLTRLHEEYRAAERKEYQAANIRANANSNDLTSEQQRTRSEIRLRVLGEFIPQAEDLLSEDQRRRIQQISFQSRLSSNPVSALLIADDAPDPRLTADVALELKLTDEQKQTLRALSREVTPEVTSGNTKEGVRVFAKQPKEFIEKVLDVLTAEQKETLNKLKGKDFDVSQLRAPAVGNPMPGQKKGKTGEG